MHLKNGPFSDSLETEQPTDTVAGREGAPLRKQRTGIQKDLEKHFIPLKQGRENIEWHKISHITCQV